MEGALRVFGECPLALEQKQEILKELVEGISRRCEERGVEFRPQEDWSSAVVEDRSRVDAALSAVRRYLQNRKAGAAPWEELRKEFRDLKLNFLRESGLFLLHSGRRAASSRGGPDDQVVVQLRSFEGAEIPAHIFNTSTA